MNGTRTKLDRMQFNEGKAHSKRLDEAEISRRSLSTRWLVQAHGCQLFDEGRERLSPS